VGRTKTLVSLGRKAFYVIEGVQIAGQAVLLTAKGLEDVERLRNGVISKLGKLVARMEELQRVNPSDPELEQLRIEQEKLVKEGEDATIEVFSGLVAQQALMIVGGALIQNLAIKKFGLRIGELEGAGKFTHRDGEKVHFDYDHKSIVGDRSKMTEAEFELAERHAGLSDTLEPSVPEPAMRRKIVETIADQPVTVVRGGKKTRLEVEGGRQVLRVADDAKPGEVLSEALRARTGKAVTPELPGSARTPAQEVAYHRNELEHLEELRKLAPTEPGLDDFTLAGEIRGQFIQMEKKVAKLPAGKERTEIEAFVARYRAEVYEPATRVYNLVSKAGGPGAIRHFESLKPAQREFVGALSEDGMKGYFGLPNDKRNALLAMPSAALDQIKANPGPKQRRLIADVDNMARSAAQDVNYDVTDSAGVVHHKEGHPFDEHGVHNTDATMFARAVNENNTKGRWSSFETQVREIEHFRRRLMDPTVPPGSLFSPINVDGAAAINNRVVTRREIMDDPLTFEQYLKADVPFREQPSSSGGIMGDAFRPDGTKVAGVRRVTVIFQLDTTGRWQVITGYPVE
jgi:hypothetical protein